VTQNNRQVAALYSPQNGGWQGQGFTTLHLALMGDPSLRMTYVDPPSDLVVVAGQKSLGFSWAPSADGAIAGYHLYRLAGDGSGITRLTQTPVTGTTASLPLGGVVEAAPGTEYMVRAVKHHRGTSGSYWNLSLGALATVP
jgi:hypothetical protein